MAVLPFFKKIIIFLGIEILYKFNKKFVIIVRYVNIKKISSGGGMKKIFLFLFMFFSFSLFSAQRQVLLEVIGSEDWPYCRCAWHTLEYVQADYLPPQLNTIIWCNDFTKDLYKERFKYYKMNGEPYAFIDGIISKIGAYGAGSKCDITCQYLYYSGEDSSECKLKNNKGFLDRMEVASPIDIQLIATFDKNTLSGTLNLHARVENDINLQYNKIWVLVYERNVQDKFGSDNIIFPQLVRARILYSDFNLKKAGEEEDFSANFKIDSGWVLENIGFLVFIQSDETKEILQSAFLGTLPLQSERQHKRPFGSP